MESERVYTQEIRNLKAEIESLNELLRTITHYRDNVKTYESNMQILRDENERLSKEIDSRTKDLEERHLEETKKTKKAAINAIREVRVKALTEAFKRLETMDLMKYQENDRLVQDVVDISTEINVVKKDRDMYKELYVNVNNDYMLVKNQTELIAKKNNETNKQLAL